jgi:hypothetical protein
MSKRTYIEPGTVFGHLTVLRDTGIRGKGLRLLCRCRCGAEKEVAAGNLRAGNVMSCGCQKGRGKRPMGLRFNVTHGMSRTRPFRIWCAMIKRCTNPKNSDYPYYGGRGIKVCDRWRQFEHFYADMGEPAHGMTIERKRVNEDYSPENCVWATRKTQSRNKRDNRLIAYAGESLTAAEWSERTGIPEATIGARLYRLNWPAERALTEAVHPGGPARGHRKPIAAAVSS